MNKLSAIGQPTRPTQPFIPPESINESNPTIRQPGFDLPLQKWSLLNSYGTGTLRCLQKEMATCRHWSVSLWRDPYDVSHCRILPSDKTEWRLISATLCWWRRCFVADQLWFMTHIREEDLGAALFSGHSVTCRTIYLAVFEILRPEIAVFTHPGH